MTREERCQEAIKRGYTYDSETGLVKNRDGNTIIRITNIGYKYIQLSIKNKKYHILQHQFAWYFVHGYCAQEIDHINGIRHDNRICNLRSVTKQQNQWNRKTVKGYYFNKANNKYKVQIGLNNKLFYVGYYNTKEQAREAYLQAKEKYHKIEEI